jgi:hypothetical protein
LGLRNDSGDQSDAMPVNQPKSVAERMRAYRHRRRVGLRRLEVQLGQPELNSLVAKGCLSSDKRDDRQAIGTAIENLLFDWVRGFA